MQKWFKKLNFGRSMLEMLAVLAIIGMLSVGGISLYQFAMDKHSANATLKDVIQRSKSVLASDPYYMRKKQEKGANYEWRFAGLPQDGTLGQVGY